MRYQPYTDEFKKEVIAEVNRRKDTLANIAFAHKMPRTTLSKWCNGMNYKRGGSFNSRKVPDSTWKLVDPLLGTEPDSHLEKRDGFPSRSALFVRRKELGIPAFAWRTKKTLKSMTRGYVSSIVEELWLENRRIEDLMYTWKRTPELRNFTYYLSNWKHCKRVIQCA